MSVTKLLCIIDPTTAEQPALTRAQALARHWEGAITIDALLCLTPSIPASATSAKAYQAADVRRHELWLAELVTPLRELGLEVSARVQLADDWRLELEREVTNSAADLVIKTTAVHSPLHRRFMQTSDWLILRASRRATLLARPDQHRPFERVLAAVDLQPGDEAHRRLSVQVVNKARTLARQLRAELHAASAYWESRNAISAEALAQAAGTEPQQAHVGDTNPEALITEVCKQHAISLVIIGSVARRGLASAAVGNTAERILDSVTADVLVLRPPE